MTGAAKKKREEFVASFENPAKVRRLAGVVWRLKLTPEEWLAKVRAGLKWCRGCGEWHPIAKFYEDAAQPDGLNCLCRGSVLKRLEEKRRAKA